MIPVNGHINGLDGTICTEDLLNMFLCDISSKSADMNLG